MAGRLWRTSGLAPAGIDVGILDDHVTPFALARPEESGSCGRGEAADLGAGRRPPPNAHGGRLGEAYPHGANGTAEAVRPPRGAAVNGIAAAARTLVTAGTGVPASGLVPAADDRGARGRTRRRVHPRSTFRRWSRPHPYNLRGTPLRHLRPIPGRGGRS